MRVILLPSKKKQNKKNPAFLLLACSVQLDVHIYLQSDAFRPLR